MYIWVSQGVLGGQMEVSMLVHVTAFCSCGCKHVGACNSLKPQILVFFMFHMYMWVSQGVLGRQIATVYMVVSMLVHVTI